MNMGRENEGGWRDSAYGDVRAEAVAREQFESPVKRQLLGVIRRDLAADEHATLELLDLQVADPPIGRLQDAYFHPLCQ